MSFDKQGFFPSSHFYVLGAIWKQYIYHVWWKYMFMKYKYKPLWNFRTLLPGTFKGNIRIRKLWLHHNPLRWVEQNLIVCLIIFHHMQHFYKCILVFKKSPLCSHLSMLPTLYSSPWPFHHLRPDQNKMMLSIWPLWIRSKKWRKDAIITDNIITINVIVPSPLSSPSSTSSLSTS